MLREEIAEFKAKLGRDSSNSAKPASSDSPYRRSPPKTPTGRRQGGQPGHPGSMRHMLDAKDIDEFVPHRPTTRTCGGALLQVATAARSATRSGSCLR